MKYLSLLALVLFFTSCASLTPVGNWDYAITNTPEGNKAGVMVVTKADKKLNATFKTADGDLKFSRFNFVSKTKKSAGEFSYQGMSVSFNALVKEQEMVGSISVQGMDFPFKATRKK